MSIHLTWDELERALSSGMEAGLTEKDRVPCECPYTLPSLEKAFRLGEKFGRDMASGHFMKGD